MTLRVLSPDTCETPTWMGWEIEGMERLLHADFDVWQMGGCLSELLAGRLLPQHGSFRCSLYRHQPERNRYERVGEWTGRQEAQRVHARQTSESRPVEKEIEDAREIDPSHELFLPLEADAVLGFVLFRAEEGLRLCEAAPSDLSFLGHAGGAALVRIRDAERLAFAHRALASTTRYLEEALELQRDAVLAIDPEGRIVAANEAVEAVLGVLPSDLIGRLAAQAFSNQTAGSLLAGAQIASHQTGQFHRLLRLMVPNGRSLGIAGEPDCATSAESAPARLQARTIEASFVCVQLDMEASPAVLVSLRDVHHGEDEEWFRERENAGEALRGEALLRPVAALRGYLGLLRDELPMRGRILDLLHSLDLQAEWLQVQLESHALLDEFRGRGSCWRDRPVSPWVLVERAIARVRSRLEARGIRALRNVPDDLPWLRVDVDKWVVALSHLMEWAVHRVEGPCVLIVEQAGSTDRGRVELQIRLEPSPGTRSFADLESLGIPDREFPYGLPLARSVVHHYGGTLLCEAPPGRLPFVKLTIPLEQSDHELHSN